MNKEDESTIGGRLLKRRIKIGMTQADLSNKTYITVATISNIEGNKRAPSIETIIELAKALNCSLDYLLLGREGTPPVKSLENTKEERILKAVSDLIELNVLYPRGEPDWNGDYPIDESYLDFKNNYSKNVILKFADQVEKLVSLKKTNQRINKQFDLMIFELIQDNKSILKSELDSASKNEKGDK